MSDSGADPIHELFQSEVRSHLSRLRAGLPMLEGSRSGGEELPPMLEAAHTIRGACRLIGLPVAAELAAWLETTLESYRARPIPAEAFRDIQTVLECFADLEVLEPAEWRQRHDAAVNQLLAELSEFPRGDVSGEGSVLDAGTAVPGTTGTSAPRVSVPESAIAPSVMAASGPSEATAGVSAVGGAFDSYAVASQSDREPILAVEPGLLELFREEIRTHVDSLMSGLLELERSSANAQAIEPLMRASHSLKGACRIIGIDAGVQLTHELEDLFVAAQSRKLSFSAAVIDRLLEAADLLALLATVEPGRWAVQYAPAIARLRALFAAVVRGEHPGDLELHSGAGSATVTVPTDKPVSPDAARSQSPAASASDCEDATPVPVPSTMASMTPAAAEAVVRVSAESLTRLMSLAGESLVQSRWLQPFANALMELKKLQDEMAVRLDRLSQAGTAEAIKQLVEELRGLSGRNRKVLSERIGDFERQAAQAEDLNLRLYREVILSRMRPFSDGAQGLPRLVRDTARRLNKLVHFELLGRDTEVDRDILERLEAPLTHLIRNAIDHGLESAEERMAAGKPPEGRIRVEARHRGGMVAITVSDDGRGIDVEHLRRKVIDRGYVSAAMAARLTEAELLEFLFLPGFSTASQVTEISGRGVGLDVVQDMVRKVGGTVQITTGLGQGTTFQFMLPLTLSVVRAVVVQVGGEPYAFPHHRIDRLLRVAASEIHSLHHRQFISVDGRSVGLVLASQLFDVVVPSPPGSRELPIILLSDVSGSYGLVVDQFCGEQDLVVRPLDPRLGKVPNVNAAAILDDGSPVLIADVEDLIRSMDQFIQSGTLQRIDPGSQGAAIRKRILVVDDSITVREVQRQILRSRGYDVELAVDGVDGWNKVRSGRFDLVVSDVDMPRMTGLEFVRRIREDTKLRELPVVIVSYKDREEDRLRGLEAGANRYLVKSSFHDDSFVQSIVDLIGV